MCIRTPLGLLALFFGVLAAVMHAGDAPANAQVLMLVLCVGFGVPYALMRRAACPRCAGSGRVVRHGAHVSPRYGPRSYDMTGCPTCHGSGRRSR